MGRLPQSVLRSTLTARSVMVLPKVPNFSHSQRMEAKASSPGSEMWQNCLRLMPSTTEVLGLKLPEAVRSSWAVRSCALFVWSYVVSAGGCVHVFVHFQKLGQMFTWSLSKEEGWWSPSVAVLWCWSGVGFDSLCARPALPPGPHLGSVSARILIASTPSLL